MRHGSIQADTVLEKESRVVYLAQKTKKETVTYFLQQGNATSIRPHLLIVPLPVPSIFKLPHAVHLKIASDMSSGSLKVYLDL